MKRNRILLNLALAATAGLLAWSLVGQGRRFEAEHGPDRPDPEPPPAAASEGPPPPPFASSFAAIVDHHLFNLDRSNDLPEELPEDTREERPLPVLMGMMGLGGEEVALMVPGGSGSSGGLYRRLEVGEVLDGYTLVRIEMDRVVMKTGAREVEVSMDDRSRKPKRTARTARPVESDRPRTTAVGSGGRRAGADRRRPARSERRRSSDTRNLPVGTVRDGKRLIQEQTPFGPIKVWVEQKSN